MDQQTTEMPRTGNGPMSVWVVPTSFPYTDAKYESFYTNNTWGVWFGRNVEIPGALCPPAGPEGGLDDGACCFHVSKAEQWAGVGGWSVVAVVWAQPSVTALGSPSSAAPSHFSVRMGLCSGPGLPAAPLSLSLAILCVTGKGICWGQSSFSAETLRGCKLFPWLGLEGVKVEPHIEIINP